MLLRVINIIIEDFSDWILIIIGPDEFGHKSEVESLVDGLGLKDKVIFINPVFNQLKRGAFSAADLFILLSYSEGAPMVILDSLATGVPVITTKASLDIIKDYYPERAAEIIKKTIEYVLEQ